MTENTRLVMSEQPPPYDSLVSPPSYPYLMSFEKPPTPPKMVPPPQSTKLYNVDFRDWLLIHSLFVTLLIIWTPFWFRFPLPIFCQYLIVQTAYTMVLFNGVIWKRIRSLKIIRFTAIGCLFVLFLFILSSKWLIRFGIIQFRLPNQPFDNSDFFSSRTWWSICQVFHIVFPVALFFIVFYTQKYLVEKVIKAEKAEATRVINLERF